MTTKQTCLSKGTLIRLAHGEFLPEELHDIEEHVAQCERCRQSMQMVEADPLWTSNILPALQTPVEATPTSFEPDDSADNEAIVRLLGPTDDPNMLGRIGHYEIVGIIGRGGMGIVFKACDAALDRFVAIKMLLPHLAASGAARRRFSREAQAAAAVIDDHVLPIYGVDEWQGIPYLVTQYSRGVTLQKRIYEQGPLELKEILRIGLQTARGLAAAHAQGLVHRDVKPSNILLDGTVERALLTDFGLARAADDASVTRTGMVTGTPQYMSPEQVRGESVDARSDLFSLGSTLYAMCTGRSPFRAESTYGVMHRITEGGPSPIQEINPDIPEWLCAIIKKLMSNRPADRFATAGELADLLEDCLAHVQQPTNVPLPKRCRELRHGFNTPERQQPTSENRSPLGRAVLWLTLGMAVLLAGVLVVLETGKGTLSIESEADGVPVRITQRGEVVKRLTVHKTGAGVRVAAGQYLVEIDSDIDGLAIKNGNVVTLKRRGKKVVNIVYTTKVVTSVTNPNVIDTPENKQAEDSHDTERIPASGGDAPETSQSTRVRRVIHGPKTPEDSEVQVPTARVLLTTLQEYDRTMEAGFTVEGTKIDIPGQRVGGNLPPTRRTWKLSMTPGKFGYDAQVQEVLSWRAIVGPDGEVPPRDPNPDYAFEVRTKVFRTELGLAEYCFFAAAPVFKPGKVKPPADDNPGLAVSASLSTSTSQGPHRFRYKYDTLWTMGRGYSSFIKRITSIKPLDDGRLAVVAEGTKQGPLRWQFVIDPEAGYLVRESKFFWSNEHPPDPVHRTFGTKWIGTVSIPTSYKLLEDTGYSDVVNSKIGGTFTSGNASADPEFLKSMESILTPPYPLPTQVVND